MPEEPERPERPVLISDTDGPFVMAAFFCERVLEEKDGVASFIRVIDRIISQAIGPGAPEKMPLTTWAATLVIGLKSGFAKGSYSVTVQGHSPTGRALPPATLPVFLEGDDRGANLFGIMQLQLDEDGLYWFDVFFEKRFLTRIPLRIVYQRLQVGGGGPGIG